MILFFIKKIKKNIVLSLACIFVMNTALLAPALAITYKEEQRLGDEVMSQVFQYYQEVTDPYVSDYINRLGYKLLGSLGSQPFTYTFHVINDPVYNAFAIPGGHVFVNSGLIMAMDDESELAGVMSHEIAHVTSRHISSRFERGGRNTLLSMGGMLAAVLAGMAGGGDAAQALLVGSLGAVQASELAYSREDELQADQVGMKILANTGYNAQGMMDILGKMRAKQYWGPKDFPTYLSSHPALDDRLAYIRTWMASPEGREVKLRTHDQTLFNYAKTRLIAMYGDIKLELPKQKALVDKKPNDVDARYRYALLLNRNGQRNLAIEELAKILQTGKYNGHVLNDLGKIYFDGGNFTKAQELLEKAAPFLDNDPENRVYLARIYADNGQLNKAENMLKQAALDFPNYGDTYYFLASTMGKKGQPGWAHFYMAQNHLLRHEHLAARRQLDLAWRNAGNDAMLKEKAEAQYNDLWRQQYGEKDDAPVLDPIGGGRLK